MAIFCNRLFSFSHWLLVKPGRGSCYLWSGF